MILIILWFGGSRFFLWAQLSLFVLVYFLESFSHVLADGLPLEANSRSPQISRTILSILADLNNAVVWILSTRPIIFKSFNNPFVTVPKVPITVGIIVTFIFHSFSIPEQSRGTYPSFHILSVLFCGQPGQQSQQFSKFSFFCCWLL